MQTPKRRSEQHRKYAGRGDDFLSPEAIRELQDELQRLEKTSRPRTVEELTRAREMGDLSENAAYSQAKARLAGIDRRMFEIRDRLKFAVIVKKGAGPGGTVKIGSTVVVNAGTRDRTFEITGAQETDPATGKISYHSPLGQALMDKKAGDEATLEINGRDVVYRIIEVR